MIGVFTAAVLGPAVLVGVAVGALHHKNLGISDADKARLTMELNAGKAAVGVMAPFDTAPAISDSPGPARRHTRALRAHRRGAPGRGGDGDSDNLISSVAALATRVSAATGCLMNKNR